MQGFIIIPVFFFIAFNGSLKDLPDMSGLRCLNPVHGLSSCALPIISSYAKAADDKALLESYKYKANGEHIAASVHVYRHSSSVTNSSETLLGWSRPLG